MRTRTIAVIAILVALAIAAGFVAWRSYLSRQAPPPPARQRQAGPRVEAPPPLPYTFKWREGAVRGVDLPTSLHIAELGIDVPLYAVTDMRSEPGEDKIAFLQRVRHTLTRYSDRQTHEACADICSNGTGFSVRITSNGATLYCAIAPACMDGDKPILESIHSHCPRRLGMLATSADEALSGRTIREGESLPRCDTERFSAADFAGRRPLWLAGRRALYVENGPKQITRYTR